MTKYKLLSIQKDLKQVNIGDYIQALAASQFYPHLDGFVERDELGLYEGEPCEMIMNGWYMAKPENWPPSDRISPLFVALHINSKAREKMLTPESIAYLKQHEPIGCRDTYTRDMLVEKGVNAYFSGCMTLTLGRNFHSEEDDGKVYFVDPAFKTEWNMAARIKNALYLLLHFFAIARIARKYPEHKSFLRKCMILVAFYREYSKKFSKRILTEAEYICQQNSDYAQNFSTNTELLKEAERLVRNYAKARLVVTSRIHCALPCLGLGTPVIFTDNTSQSEASACRFGGLRELFNIMTWINGELKVEFPWKGKITLNKNIPSNKDTWKQYAAKLSERCTAFIKESTNQK